MHTNIQSCSMGPVNTVHIRHSKLLAPVVVVLLTIGAIGAVWGLVAQAESRRQAQVQIGSLRLSVADLQSAPFTADPRAGGSPDKVAIRIQTDEATISRGLEARSQTGVPSSLLAAGRTALAAIEPVVTQVFRIAAGKGGLAGAGARVPILDGAILTQTGVLSRALGKISRTDADEAASARAQIELGATGAMLLLLVAFAFFYFRSVAAREAVERLASENEHLLDVSRGEARTDALTQLGNRRALAIDLASAIAQPHGSDELLLAMFDLDGFKQYNDTFGHPAGDSLLHRLGGRLSTAAAPFGSAYRMGGDEFCTLARCSPSTAAKLVDDAVAALEDHGAGWHIGCSHGIAWMPSEARTESQALNLADERMYAKKESRSSASRQVTDALLQVITEQNPYLDDHVERVSELSGTLAKALGEPEYEIQRIRQAARLHDIGKAAIPAAILDNPGPLDGPEWEFMRRHPMIGERIVMAAPALAPTAELIRSSHERVDGHGYPDELTGEDIPLGARIIAVCDAFDAMTSNRAYQQSKGTEDEALEELGREAGAQFDPAIVEAFCSEIRHRHAAAATPPARTSVPEVGTRTAATA